MSGNIKTIRFTTILSTIFALLTYIISLNMELSFFDPNWTWISNNFALAVCSGIFASTLVVLLCEIQKYLSNKVNLENYLFYQAEYLYFALFLIQGTTKEFIDTPTEIVPENLLEDNARKAQCQLNAIQGVDYVTFSKKSRVMVAQRNFCSEVIPRIKSFLMSDNYLKREILAVQISNLEQFGMRKAVTTAEPNIFQMLKVVNEKSGELLENVSNYISAIDNSCHNRFAWKKQKEEIHKNYTSIFKVVRLEDFMKNGE